MLPGGESKVPAGCSDRTSAVPGDAGELTGVAVELRVVRTRAPAPGPHVIRGEARLPDIAVLTTPAVPVEEAIDLQASAVRSGDVDGQGRLEERIVGHVGSGKDDLVNLPPRHVARFPREGAVRAELRKGCQGEAAAEKTDQPCWCGQ